jgi:hypothetical protein
VAPEKFISAFAQHLKRQGRTDLPKVFPYDPNGVLGLHGIVWWGLISIEATRNWEGSSYCKQQKEENQLTTRRMLSSVKRFAIDQL